MEKENVTPTIHQKHGITQEVLDQMHPQIQDANRRLREQLRQNNFDDNFIENRIQEMLESMVQTMSMRTNVDITNILQAIYEKEGVNLGGILSSMVNAEVKIKETAAEFGKPFSNAGVIINKIHSLLEEVLGMAILSSALLKLNWKIKSPQPN